jgi:hypothetical protein
MIKVNIQRGFPFGKEINAATTAGYKDHNGYY